MSQRTRLGVIVAAVAVAVAGVVIASSSGGKSSKPRKVTPPPGTVSGAPAPPTPPPVPKVVIRNGRPVGGIRTIKVSKGDRVRFTVESDVADEVHVHGYDLHKDVPKGGTVNFAFPASID